MKKDSDFRNHSVELKNPGPQEYSIKADLTKRHFPTIRIGTAEQRADFTDKTKLETPPPNSYFILFQNQQGVKFSKSKRSGDTSHGQSFIESPGPGTYKIPTSFGNLPHYEKSRKNDSQFI